MGSKYVKGNQIAIHKSKQDSISSEKSLLPIINREGLHVPDLEAAHSF
jgi:hypothetical protein